MNKIICEQCGEYIEHGDEYCYIDITGDYIHECCKEEYWEELIDCSTTRYVRGEEDE